VLEGDGWGAIEIASRRSRGGASCEVPGPSVCHAVPAFSAHRTQIRTPNLSGRCRHLCCNEQELLWNADRRRWHLALTGHGSVKISSFFNILYLWVLLLSSLYKLVERLNNLFTIFTLKLHCRYTVDTLSEHCRYTTWIRAK
jgi:hypothetical protein